MLLTEHDIALNHVVRSEINGQAPAIVFDIVNREQVNAMIEENTYLWGTYDNSHTERLQYVINEADDTLTISRAVSPKGTNISTAMNQSLALSILSLVLSSHGNDGVRADIMSFPSPSREITNEMIQIKRAQYQVEDPEVDNRYRFQVG
jgi:hypothetical protein